MNRPRRPFWRRALPWLGVVVGAGVVALLVLVVLVKITDRPAKVPTGFTPPTSVPRSTALPTDRLLFDSDRTGHFEIYVMRADGSGVKALTKDRRFDSWWPRLSPDRRTVVFYRSPAGKHDLDFSVTSLWAMAVDGSRLTQLRPPGLDGWTFQGHAEWSPDGRRLTMFGGSRINPQIFVTNSLGQKPRQVTDRPGTNIDPSWAPDGKHLVFVGCPRSICTEADYEIYRIPVAGGQAERVTRNDVPDYDPYYSPDGRQLGWLQKLGGKGIGVWDVRLAGPDGQSARRLAGDAGVTSRPQWSADGTKIYMHRIAPGGAKFDIYVTDASGDGPLRMVTKGQPGNNEYPSP
jgi:Tol biopolymer transport system component